ncbi:hypothetical protein vBCbaSRXM_126 [Citromicrobium phage vB_CbaS-RXM]|nr:hypothetical protein vBCbaSRXM_126 [Citromicrobium phage vB_CbaS-RXM]
MWEKMKTLRFWIEAILIGLFILLSYASCVMQ